MCYYVTVSFPGLMIKIYQNAGKLSVKIESIFYSEIEAEPHDNPCVKLNGHFAPRRWCSATDRNVMTVQGLRIKLRFPSPSGNPGKMIQFAGKYHHMTDERNLVT